MATRIGLAQHADRSQVEADTISYSATTSSLTAGFGSIHGNIHYLESLPYKCTLKRIASTSTSSEAGTVASTCNDSVRCFCLPRVVDPGKFREIADQLGALLMADVAPISALIATSSTFLRSSNPMSSRSLPTRLCFARVRGYSFSGTPRRIQTSRRRSIWRFLSGYPRVLGLGKSREIAGEVGAPLMADVAHKPVRGPRVGMTLFQVLRVVSRHQGEDRHGGLPRLATLTSQPPNRQSGCSVALGPHS